MKTTMSEASSQSNIVFGVEGPAGSGKSTMATTVGNELHIPVVEGGRYYRQLTYAALQENLDLDDTDQIAELASKMPERFANPSGITITYNNIDVTDELQEEIVSTNVARVSRQLEVREIIEEQIRQAVFAHETTIIVGRWIKKLIPEAYVLTLTIDPQEAEIRHRGRVSGNVQSVMERNKVDLETSHKLGVVGLQEATIDVTFMTPEEQATIFRNFIQTYKPQ